MSYVTDFFFFAGFFDDGNANSSLLSSSCSIVSSINGRSGDGGCNKFPNVFCLVLFLIIVVRNGFNRVSLIDLSC